MLSDALSVGASNENTSIIDSGATKHMSSSEADMVQHDSIIMR